MNFSHISGVKGKGHKTLEKISTSSIYLKKMNIPFHKKTCIRWFIIHLFIISPNWKQLKCSTIGYWTYIFYNTYNVTYYLIKNKGMLLHAT